MISADDFQKIKEGAEEFFTKMTLSADINIKAEVSNVDDILVKDDNVEDSNKYDTVAIAMNILDPQILIGRGGQTLDEIQRILRVFLNRKVGKNFYLDFDINGYKKEKVEYLRDLVRGLADEVSFNKKDKELSPMSAYERRIVHMELADRSDVIAESDGIEPNRRVVIRPR
ncbi:MAG: R3H domain-containing nucleic acid-binding protein [Candidatus Staskawiczbacteria bacterium]|jgi:spoIIIJ-associated protein